MHAIFAFDAANFEFEVQGLGQRKKKLVGSGPTEQDKMLHLLQHDLVELSVGKLV